MGGHSEVMELNIEAPHSLPEVSVVALFIGLGVVFMLLLVTFLLGICVSFSQKRKIPTKLNKVVLKKDEDSS